MRIQRLDLIRFGKFTDRAVELPAAGHDFHVVVGPNEAGKSTLRAAILDLFYGIPKNTGHGFLHPMPDLRLGASIAHGGETLVFHRAKALRQTLRSSADAVLPEGTLGTFLGTTDRDFFDQMFGLDHARLVQGGHSILSASGDLGQILFQSAAGIGQLGAVREALEAEADSLWAKRRSGERAYYVAKDDLERATAALKAATVKTRDWSQAQDRVVELEAEHALARTAHAAIKTRRNLLERARRVKPHLHVLDDVAQQLDALGAVADLPESAAQTLTEAQREAAAAQAGIIHATQMVEAAQTVIASIEVDGRMRELGTEITELNERRLQYRAHQNDIARRQAEVEAHWGLARGLAEQLGWDASLESDVLARVPSLAVRAALDRLVRGHASLQQETRAAERALAAKEVDIRQASEALAALPAGELSAGLQAALIQAQKLGDFELAARERQEQIQQKEAGARAAFQRLGPWPCTEAELCAMTEPAPERVNAFLRDQTADDADARAASAKTWALADQIRQLELDISQFRETHQPVSREQVLQARQKRDGLWLDLKAEPQALPARSEKYEQLLQGADALADIRHDKVQQASELQSRLQQLQRLQLELEAAQGAVQRLAQAGVERAGQWAQLAQAHGLPALSFQAAPAWLEARRLALEAAQALALAQGSQTAHAALCDDLRATLAGELQALGQPSGNEPLAVQVMQANGIAKTLTDAGGQRRILAKQLTDARTALPALSQAVASARSQSQEWLASWTQTLAWSGLAPQDLALIEGSLETVKKLDGALASMHKIRVERIQTMQADLDAQAVAARQLALRCAPDVADQAAQDIALALQTRLQTTNEAHQELTRQKAALLTANAQLDEATARLQQAHASLAPLLASAGCGSHAELAEAITRSDQCRDLRLTAAAAERAIRDAADGLALAQVRLESAVIDMADLRAELDDLTTQDEQLVNQLSQLAARRQSATEALATMGGTADAARAEGQRQEALAKMASTVERFLKVQVAARLLKWSIDQYREAKQGPMLSLAGGIFRRLTLGSFERLTVDFDSTPLKLKGRRPDGKEVEIEGMSEGTRDQLYLALRLAALDMHLGQAHVLPFIADDLFINYDDQRTRAGLQALAELSKKTQVIFLTHHAHILPLVKEVFGSGVNVVSL